MNKQKEILKKLLILDLFFGSVILIIGFLLGVSIYSILCVVPLLVNLYCIYLLRQNKVEFSINLTTVSIIFSIYIVDTGIHLNIGTYLFYIPVLIGIYLFDSIGAKKTKMIGLISTGIAFLLVNLGLSPQLMFKELVLLTTPIKILYYTIFSSVFCSMAVLEVFSQLRKEVLAQLLKNQANNLALLENSKDAIWSVDRNFNLISYNSTYAKMFQAYWHREPKSGVNILFENERHKIYEQWNNWYRRALTGEAFSLDIEYFIFDEQKIFEISFTPIYQGNELNGTVAKAIDITQRKRVYLQQQLISENLELLLSSTQEIIFEMDEEDRCQKVWKGENQELKFPEVFYIGKTVEELFDIPFQIEIAPVFHQVKTDGKPREYKFSNSSNQMVKHYVAKIRKIKNSQPTRVSIVMEDITHNREFEMMQEQQSDFLNKLIAHLPIGVFVKSVQKNLSYTLWNKELENIFELREEEVLGKTDQELFKDSEEIASYISTDNLVLLGKEPVLIQKLKIQVGNNQIFVRTFKIPILDAEGNVETILGILENITDTVNSQMELENAEKRWNYALSGSRDAVWDLNLATGHSFFSEVYNEMLGYKSFETIPEKLEDLIHPEDAALSQKLFREHLEGKSYFYECEYRLRKKDGTYFWVLSRGKVAETDADGNAVRVIGTFSHIDYRKKLEEEYKIALQKAEEASKAKSLFLSTMSHEIRTPMNGVIGIINFLLNENTNKAHQENLEALKYSADNLMFLLNDILDFSKIDAGKIDIDESNFDLTLTLQNTLKSYLSVARNKGIELEFISSDNFPKKMLGDPLRLNQIFNNLISNAIKFTPSGKVLIEATTEEISREHIQIRFSCEDTGIGIDDNYLPSLFEHFTQASSDTTRKYGGTGLGLAICKRLVEILGGELQVKSKKGVGTTFWFSLKFKIDTNEGEEKDSLWVSRYATYPGMQLLLVEDNQMNIFVAKKFLNKWDIHVDVAENGKEALIAVQNKKYDLILMDLQMPEMDGFEATSHIRKAGIQTPILALSANVNSDAKSKVEKSGMNDYISKPFKPEELFQKIGLYYKPARKGKKSGDTGDKLF